MGKDGINAFVGRGQVMGSEAQDRSISPTALQFVVRLSLPLTGDGLSGWPRGEWWATAWSICLGCNKAAVMPLLGCLRGMNAFITVVPFGGWATILRFFWFYLFWRQQENKWDVKGHREHFLQSQKLKHVLVTRSLISGPQDSLVSCHPKNLFHLVCSSRVFWIYMLKIYLQ